MPEDNEQQNDGAQNDGSQNEQEPQVGAKEAAAPEWAKKKISDLNAENANWRTKFRDAEQKLAAAKTPEEFAKLQADFTKERTELERALVIASAGIPEELQEFVTGTTKEELEASAAKLAKFVKEPPRQPAPKGDLNGGKEPRSDEDDASAVAAAIARVRARRNVL